MKKRSFLLPTALVLASALSVSAHAAKTDSESADRGHGGEFVIVPTATTKGIQQMPDHYSHSSHSSHASHASHASSGY